MKKYIVFIFSFVLMIFFAMNVTSLSPSMPHQFYGNISYNGELVGNNCKLVLQTPCFNKECLIQNGIYGINPTCIAESETEKILVNFYLEGKKIGEHVFTSRESTELNFVINFLPKCFVATPYCGDLSCNNGETCSTCVGDCGACPPPNNDGGGSSGGGGSSVVPNKNTGNSGSSYILLNNEENNTEQPEETTQDSNSNKRSWITGGVIGVLGSNSGIALIIGLVILLIGTYFVFSKKRLPERVSLENEKSIGVL